MTPVSTAAGDGAAGAGTATIGAAAADSSIRTGTNVGTSAAVNTPWHTWRRQVNTRLAHTPCRAATSLTRVIRLMVDLLFAEDDNALSPGTVALRTIYDPTASTGGMLSVAKEHLKTHNPDAGLTMFGQELNDESYAICKADMLIKGQSVDSIALGNTLSDDAFPDLKSDYMLASLPQPHLSHHNPLTRQYPARTCNFVRGVERATALSSAGHPAHE